MAVASSRLERLTYPRELLVNLTLRELRGKYKRSTLGWAWSVINPLALIVVYTIVFGSFFGAEPPVGDPSDLHSYAFYLVAGLLPWLFLSNGITGAVASLTGNEGLIKKVYFPRSILPTSSTVLQENDTVHVLMRADSTALVERILTSAPAVTA